MTVLLVSSQLVTSLVVRDAAETWIGGGIGKVERSSSSSSLEPHGGRGEVLEAEEEACDCGEVHGEPLRPLLLPFGPFGEAHGEGWWEPFGEPAEGVALTDGEGSRGNRS